MKQMKLLMKTIILASLLFSVFAPISMMTAAAQETIMQSEQSIFTTQVPTVFEKDSRYELGTRFSTELSGQITKVRLYAGEAEGGEHQVRIWDAAGGILLAGPYSWTFEAGAAEWKTFELPEPVEVTAHTDYIVAISNSTDQYYAAESNGFGKPIINGDLVTYKGSGLFNTTLGQMPSSSYGDTNYYRDVVFIPKLTGEPESLFDESKTSERFSDHAAYDMGVKFSATVPGWVTAVKVFGLKGAAGKHDVYIWSNKDAKLLAGPYSFDFIGDNKWVTFELPDALSIEAGVEYTAVVSTGNEKEKYYPAVNGDFAKSGTNGSYLFYPVNAGVFTEEQGTLPTTSYGGGNYLRDIVFVPSAAVPVSIRELNKVNYAIEALGMIDNLNLEMSNYNDLSDVQKLLAVSRLLNARPDNGFSSKSAVQSALDQAIIELKKSLMEKALKYVNWAYVDEAMTDALISSDLQLSLNLYEKLNAIQKKSVAEQMIKKRPNNGYANQAAVQETFSNVVFGDIKGHVEERKLIDWINKGYLNGFSDATIRPDATIDGAAFIQMAKRALQLTDEEALQADQYVDRPNQKLTFETGAVITAKLLNLNTNISLDEINKYNDSDKIKAENKKYVNAILSGGYWKPKSTKTLSAHKHLTRAEAVSLLYYAADPDVDQPNFFPLGVWQQSSSNAMAYKNMGINMYVHLSGGFDEAAYENFDKANMKAVLSQNSTDRKYWSSNIIYAWMQSDEPDNAQPDGSAGYGPPIQPSTIIEHYHEWKQADPTRPIFMNLSQGVAWKEWYGRGVDTGNQELYLEYVKAADIVSFDIYPVNSTDAPVTNNLHMVADGVDNLKEWTNGKKPVWTAIETSNYDGVPGHTPTPEQIHSEVWSAIIHGANGLFYFTHTFQPKYIEATPLQDKKIGNALTQLNKQIRMLAPIINNESTIDGVNVVSSSEEVPIDMMVKGHNDSIYIFASAMRAGDTTASFTVPFGSEVEVIGENRSIPVSNGKFEDSFSSYGVHLYKVK